MLEQVYRVSFNRFLELIGMDTKNLAALTKSWNDWIGNICQDVSNETLYADRKAAFEAAFEAGWNANRGMKHVPQLEIEHWSDKNIDSITFIV